MKTGIDELQLPIGLNKLIRRLRRGGIIFHSLSLLFLGCGCAALIFRWGIAWFLFAFVMSLICRLTFLLHIGRRYVSARKIVENPQIVYWGHAINGQGQAMDLVVTEARTIRLHLKDGTHLSVETVRGTGTSLEQLREVISWLRQKNPEIRWGNYDKPCF
jgi:hypothetical protein